MYRTTVAVVLLLAVAVYSQDVVQLCKTVTATVGSHFVRSPKNCSEFFNCRGDLSFPVMLACGKGTVFSQAFQVCVYRDSYFNDCNKSRSGGQVNDPLCKVSSGLNSDPKDCNRFIPCFEGSSYPTMNCQASLHFSVKEQRCMESSKAGCYVPVKP